MEDAWRVMLRDLIFKFIICFKTNFSMNKELWYSGDVPHNFQILLEIAVHGSSVTSL